MLGRFLRVNGVWRNIRFASSVVPNADKVEVKSKPKPPPGIFGLYFNDNSEEFRSKNVYLNQNELIRLMGEEWKELPQADKEAYRTKFTELLDEYKQHMIDFEDNLSDDQRIVQALKDMYSDMAKETQSKIPIEFPRRPTTAFAHFLKAAKESFPKSTSQTTSEWNETMAQKWRDMNEEEKSTFREASKQSYMKFAMDKEIKETFSLDEVGGFRR